MELDWASKCVVRENTELSPTDNTLAGRFRSDTRSEVYWVFQQDMQLPPYEVTVFSNVCAGFTVAFSKATSLYRKSSDCTEKDIAISVKCPLDRRREVVIPNNRSSCCFFSVFNSSHPSEACDLTESEVSRNNAKNSESATARSESNSFRLRTCEGSNVRLLCEVNVTSCSDVVRWRSLDGKVWGRRTLFLSNVHKVDAGTYTCEVTDFEGKMKQKGTVRIEVQFAPVILVPNSSVSIWTDSEDVLECQSEASPRPTITWYLEGAPLTPSLHAISSEASDCRTTSYVFFTSKNGSRSSQDDSTMLQNYTCLAENELGKAVATLLIASFIEESSSTSKETEARRPFNVTGFILGMLPPLFISFYIILKLGYRSRYAEERGDDDGFQGEAFFISY